MKIRLKRDLLVTFVLLIWIGLCPSACSNKASNDITSQIKRVENNLQPAAYIQGQKIPFRNIRERMKHYHVPGVSIAVIDQGKITWAKGYGVKDAESKEPVTSETFFQAASISKPVTALAALHLVEKSLLSLDLPVNEKLQSWKIPDNRFSKKEPVTLRHLLTHNSGLTIHGFPGYGVTSKIPSIIQVLDGKKPANTGPVRVNILPGSQFRYSGGGFTVAQLLIEEVTQKPFFEFMKDTVLDPIGMKHSTFQQPLPPDKAPMASSAHEADGRVIEGKWHVYPEQAAAGLWTTPSDLCRFALELQKSASGESNKIISRDMTQKMLTPGKGNWGLGISVSDSGGIKSFSHGGGNKGFICYLFAYVSEGRGAVVMTNSDNGGDLRSEIFRSLSLVYDWDDFKIKEIELFKIPSEQLRLFTGDFQIPSMPDASFQVLIEKDHLHLRSNEMGDWLLIPVSETKFINLETGRYVGFFKKSDEGFGQMKIGSENLTQAYVLNRIK